MAGGENVGGGDSCWGYMERGREGGEAVGGILWLQSVDGHGKGKLGADPRVVGLANGAVLVLAMAAYHDRDAGLDGAQVTAKG